MKKILLPLLFTLLIAGCSDEGSQSLGARLKKLFHRNRVTVIEQHTVTLTNALWLDENTLAAIGFMEPKTSNYGLYLWRPGYGQPQQAAQTPIVGNLSLEGPDLLHLEGLNTLSANASFKTLGFYIQDFRRVGNRLVTLGPQQQWLSHAALEAEVPVMAMTQGWMRRPGKVPHLIRKLPEANAFIDMGLALDGPLPAVQQKAVRLIDKHGTQYELPIKLVSPLEANIWWDDRLQVYIIDDAGSATTPAAHQAARAQHQEALLPKAGAPRRIYAINPKTWEIHALALPESNWTWPQNRMYLTSNGVLILGADGPNAGYPTALPDEADSLYRNVGVAIYQDNQYHLLVEGHASSAAISPSGCKIYVPLTTPKAPTNHGAVFQVC